MKYIYSALTVAGVIIIVKSINCANCIKRRSAPPTNSLRYTWDPSAVSVAS